MADETSIRGATTDASLTVEPGDVDVDKAAIDHLQMNILQVRALIFAVISCIAPSAAAIFNTAVMASTAGASTPLIFLIGGIGILLLVAPISYFARHLTSTAGFYTWVSHGLGRDAGFLTGWLVFGSYALFEAASQAAFGGLMDVNLSTFFNFSIAGGYGWVIYSLASVIIVGILGYFGVQNSMRILAVLSTLEVLALLVFDVFVTFQGGKHGQDLVHTFTPAGADPNIIHGIAPGGFLGLGLAIAFVVFSNIGFESSSAYGEEAKNPHRAIPLAMISVLIVVSVLYIWTAYSSTIGVGVENAGSVLGNISQAPGPVYGLASTFVAPWFEVILAFLLTTSTWASCLAFHNGSARYLYGMAREGVFPFANALGRTQERTKSPWVASTVQTGISLIFIVFLAFVVQQPLKDGSVQYALGIAGGNYVPTGGIGSYSWLAAVGTLTLIVVYILTAIAAPLYARRRERELGTRELNWFTHIVAPILGIAVMIIPLISFVLPSPFPTNILPIFFVVWAIAGILYLFLFLRRKTEVYEKIGHLVRLGE